MLKLKSFAKINIGLEVLYKRKDGYHEINTIFSKICLADDIIIEPNKELVVECIPSIGIHQTQNLAYKSSKLIQKYFDCKSKAAKITIFKNIPLGGGLGGGSSNAATVLTGLNEFWRLNATKEELINIAKELGADVPFFLSGNFAVGHGIGDKLEYFDFDLPYHLLLVISGFKIDTPWAYSQLKRTKDQIPVSNLKEILLTNIKNQKKLQDLIRNDFEEIAFSKFPELFEIKKHLYKRGAVLALMSGSGSTMYGFFDDYNMLKKAKEFFKNYQTYEC